MKSKVVEIIAADRMNPLGAGALRSGPKPQAGWTCLLGAASFLSIAFAPAVSRGCACGCGVFDVGTSPMLGTRSGWMSYAEWDFQDQNRNWDGSNRAPASENPDKEISTHFLSVGVQYLTGENWGFQVDLPYDFRTFRTTSSAPGNPVVPLSWHSLGDIRLKGIYTGFSSDLHSGLTFGVKLPTGDWSHENAYGDIDRDSEIGTGSTDLLLGAYHVGNITSDHQWSWYAQGQLDVPTLTQAHYRPGVELDAAAGVYYNGLTLGGFKVRPILQLIGSARTSDSGSAAANPVASGYQRLFISPGLEIDRHPWKIYADIEIPIYQHFTGDQLASSILLKAAVSFMF